jgi:hypothetical protein
MRYRKLFNSGIVFIPVALTKVNLYYSKEIKMWSKFQFGRLAYPCLPYLRYKKSLATTNEYYTGTQWGERPI